MDDNTNEQDLGLVIADGALLPQDGPVIPQIVSRRRGLQALFLKYGITEDMVLDHITATIEDPAHRYMVATEFRTSQTFERMRPLVVEIGASLGLNLDTLFILAAQLP